MSLIVKEEKKEFKLDEQGLYLAKCISVIELGYQETEYEGRKKQTDQVLLQFELPEMVIAFEKDGEKKSFNRVISKTYTRNIGEKSNLRKDLNRWRGKAFTAEELKGFDLMNVLGKDCQIQIIHETKNDKTFQKTEILPVSKNHKAIKVENELISFDFDKNTFEDISKLSEWIQIKIKKSSTYEAKRVEILRQQYSVPNHQTDEGFNVDDYIGEDEINF